MRRLKQLETANARLRRALAHRTLDNQILQEAGELPSASRRRQCTERQEFANTSAPITARSLRPGRSEPAWPGGSQHALHRARLAMGERLSGVGSTEGRRAAVKEAQRGENREKGHKLTPRHAIQE